MDVVINAPGSGGWDNSGTQQIDPGAIGVMNPVPAGAPIPALGSDLRDDHPVSIAYAGGACTGVFTDCDPSVQPLGDPDFQTAQYATINTNDQWWVDVSTVAVPGTPNLREKTDMILYTRDFSGTGGPSVECASCHDPHEAVKQPVSFLRISNDNSDVCLSCHIK
jgi:predicted CXXCH cytochrome family protein